MYRVIDWCLILCAVTIEINIVLNTYFHEHNRKIRVYIEVGKLPIQSLDTTTIILL